MKNYEKYADEIRKYNEYNFCKDFVIPNILKSDNCRDIHCDACNMFQMIWLLEDYEEPETDWSKVPVDTLILVRNDEDEEWLRRYFTKYENGKVYAWGNGCTSRTTNNMYAWNYTKLTESEEK